MMSVPSYQLIQFLSWLHDHDIRFTNEHEARDRLVKFAKEYLKNQPNNRPPYIYNNLIGLMTIFQECPNIGEETIYEQIKHFSECGQCLHYLRIHWQTETHFSGDHHFGMRDDFGSLHPLLFRFTQYARESELEYLFRESVSHFEIKGFEHFIHRNGHELYRCFSRFLQDMENKEPALIKDYEYWHQYRKRSDRQFPVRHAHSRDDDGHPISSNESLNDAANRLADSVIIFYDRKMHGGKDINPNVSFLLSKIITTSDNLPQVLEFLEWFHERDPELRIQGNIPATEIANLALQFCDEKGYTNGLSFSKETQKWLSGKGSSDIIRRITRYLKLDKKDIPDGTDITPNNPLDRYGSVRYHALFLFLSSGDFPSFINKYWRDLHYLTWDYLDIYYSQNDLENRVSGHKIVNDFKNANLRVESIPAIFLWEKNLEDGIAIPLLGLTHDQIYDVVEKIVNSIKEGHLFNEIATSGNDRVMTLQSQNRPGVNVHNVGTFQINQGEISTMYINNGQVGAMGDHAIALHNTFIQDARKTLLEVKLNEQDLTILNTLATQMATHPIENLDTAEKLEGATHLAKIVKNVKAGENAEEPLSDWKKWVAKLGNRSITVLSILASIVTFTPAVMKLLGLPNPM